MSPATRRIIPLVVLLAACGPKTPPQTAATPPRAEAPGDDLSQPTQTDEHPLLGILWRASDSAQINEATLLADLATVDIVMLGETHDNPEHHVLQARLIQALSPQRVAYEMLGADDAFAEATSAQDLASAVAWDDSGWPEFAMYEPVFSATFSVGATPLAAHPSSADVEQAMHSRSPDLGDNNPGIPLNRAPTGVQLQALQQEIVDAHCGHANADVTEMMVAAQILKDAWMAQALIDAGPGVVFIAGNGHTRPDRGVPSYLDATSRTVSFREVQAGETDPTAYVDGGADYLWFTDRLNDEDPCEAFAEQLRQMREE